LAAKYLNTTTVDHGLSQGHASATSVVGNMWEGNVVAMQLKVNCS